MARLTATRTAAKVRLRRKPLRASSGALATFSSMPKYALQDAQRREQRDQRAAALADERQRHAGHRHEPDVHADVDEHLEQDKRHDPHGDKPSERVIGVAGDAEAAEEQDDEEPEEEHGAGEAELFGSNAEDVVRRLGAQVIELRLGAVREALPEYATRADADLRLQDVEPGPERIFPGIAP